MKIVKKMLTAVRKIVCTGVLLTGACQPVWALDAVALDKMLATQNYEAVLAALGNGSDPAALAYMRKHYKEWHQPIAAHFLFNRIGLNNLSTVDRAEAISAGARAYVMMEIEKTACINRNQRYFGDQVMLFNSGISQFVQSMRSRTSPVTEAFAEALAWAKAQEGNGAKPAAKWLCGESNMYSDDVRLARRKDAYAALTLEITGPAADAASASSSAKPARGVKKSGN